MEKEKKLKILKKMRADILNNQFIGFCQVFLNTIYYLDRELYHENLERIEIAKIVQEDNIKEKILLKHIPELKQYRPEIILENGFWFAKFNSKTNTSGKEIRIEILDKIIEKLETNEL